MRDLRDDLRERLGLLSERRQKAKAQYDGEIRAIDTEEGPLKALLALEERRLGGPEHETKGMGSLPDFFAKMMENGPATKDELREAADILGFFTDAGAAGRVTHATLVNMVRGGRIRELAEGKFELVAKSAIHDHFAKATIHG